LGIRRFSISTCGIVEGIEKFSNEKMDVNLAISLHAPNDILRSKIMPINKKYSLEKVLKAVDDYVKKTRRKVMFEYVMIKGVNDTDECARELSGLLTRFGSLCFVNFIAYNPASGSGYKPSLDDRIRKFAEILKKSGVQTTIRYRFGREIRGACGQLVGHLVKN